MAEVERRHFVRAPYVQVPPGDAALLSFFADRSKLLWSPLLHDHRGLAIPFSALLRDCRHRAARMRADDTGFKAADTRGRFVRNVQRDRRGISGDRLEALPELGSLGPRGAGDLSIGPRLYRHADRREE